MKFYFSLIVLALSFFTACNSSNQISKDEVSNLIADYLEENPLFETGKFNTNKQKLDSTKDKDLLITIQELADEGLIDINNEKSRKRWFSKDSVYIISPTLTKEALPYLVKQNKNKGITIEKNSEKVVICNVVLDKEKTPFYNFGKDPYPNTTFITQKFKLKYNEKNGWKIIKK